MTVQTSLHLSLYCIDSRRWRACLIKGIRVHGPSLCGDVDCDQIMGSVPGGWTLPSFGCPLAVRVSGLCGAHRPSNGERERPFARPEDDPHWKRTRYPLLAKKKTKNQPPNNQTKTPASDNSRRLPAPLLLPLDPRFDSQRWCCLLVA